METSERKLSRQLLTKMIFQERLYVGDPRLLKIPQLKQWLLRRNTSTKGKKVDFVLRYADNG